MPPPGDKSSLPAHDPQGRVARRTSRSGTEARQAEITDTTPGAVFDADKDLPGAVFMVPNRHWGFESASSEDHPGACAHYSERVREAILVKGTDAENVR